VTPRIARDDDRKAEWREERRSDGKERETTTGIRAVLYKRMWGWS
jgi:hypothetical protein